MSAAARLRGVVGGLLLLAMAQAGAASACSPRSGYRVPTGLDMAALADTIVVARVDGAREGAVPGEGAVLATPVVLVKGARLPARVELDGAVLSTDRGIFFRSDPRELRRPNAGALIGGCVRYAFARGEQLVLFLKRDAAGGLVPFRSAFARDAEGVGGPDALWVRVVRDYAAIGALPVADRPAALRRRSAQLRASGRADDRAIADDLDIELHGRRSPPTD